MVTIVLGTGAFQQLARFSIPAVRIATHGRLYAHGYNQGKQDEGEYVDITNTGGIHREVNVGAKGSGCTET